MRNGQLEDFLQLPEVQKKAAQRVADVMQKHYTPRLAVFLWDRLDLSRREYDHLRHLICFKYHPPPVDNFIPLRLWEHPDDKDDFVDYPILPGRYAREREFASIAVEANIQVSASGKACQRDARVAASELYSAYGNAMRRDYSEHRLAQPVFLFDGTGQSLGKGLCHAELGSADFKGDCRQSRKTLQPLQASEGNDHAISIRETMDYASNSFNQLIAAAKITLDTGESIPAKPIASADFQAVKAMTATSEQTHSVWCACLAGDRQHNYCKVNLDFDAGDPASVDAAYARMIKFIESDARGPKCKFKSFDDQCCWNQVSPSVARGGPFRRFKCNLCGYNPTEAKWRKDMADFAALSDAEQSQARKRHRENGETIYKWSRHHFAELFMSPMLHLDCKDIGVDMLHLIYLNLFKHLFNYTVHQPLPGVGIGSTCAQHVYSVPCSLSPQIRRRRSCATTSPPPASTHIMRRRTTRTRSQDGSAARRSASSPRPTSTCPSCSSWPRRQQRSAQ